jgi:hypothetical protein
MHSLLSGALRTVSPSPGGIFAVAKISDARKRAR